MNDNKKIKNLYESIKRVDYFQSNNFNWEEFIKVDEGFLDLGAVDLYDYLLEGFEKIKTDAKQDIYKVTLHNGLVFDLLINYANAKENFEVKEVGAKTKHHNKAANSYKDILYTNFDITDTLCIVMFRDERGRTDRTGDVKMSSKELFFTLKKAIQSSWSQRDYNKIKAIMMRVDSNDKERLEFYKMLVTKMLPDFNKLVEDTETEPNTTILYALKTT